LLESIRRLKIDNEKLNIDKDNLITKNHKLSIKIGELEDKGLFISKLKTRVESVNDIVNTALKSIESIKEDIKNYKLGTLKSIDEMERLVKVQVSNIDYLKNEFNSSSNHSQNNLKELTIKLTEANAKLREMEIKLKENKENLVKSETKLNELTNKLNENEEHLAEINKKYKELEKENKRLREQLTARKKDNTIDKLNKTLFKVRKELENRNKDLSTIKEQKQ